jgi:hypothetical protein
VIKAARSVICALAMCACASPSEVRPLGLTAVFAGPAAVRVGDSAEFTLTVHNGSSDRVVEALESGGGFRVEVTDVHGNEIWDSSAGVRVSSSRVLDLAPGADIIIHGLWDLRDDERVVVSPATYYIHASLRAADRRALAADNVVHQLAVTR